MWKFELQMWRAKIARERGGPVRWRLETIEEIDEAIAFLTQTEKEGRLVQSAVWGVWKN
jgi:hypothetical protein